MSFQLSLPASLPSPEATHSLASLASCGPGTLTVEVLTREERGAQAQHAKCRIATREAQGSWLRVRAAAQAGAPLTFTA